MKFILGVIMFTAFMIFSCNQNQKTKIEIDKRRILELHEKQRYFHFNKMHTELVAQMTDSFISINRGKLSFPTKKEMEARFGNYFNTVEFEKWDDVNEPLIIFSDDRSLANVFVDKEVVLTYRKDSIPIKETTRFAGLLFTRKIMMNGSYMPWHLQMAKRQLRNSMNWNDEKLQYILYPKLTGDFKRNK